MTTDPSAPMTVVPSPGRRALAVGVIMTLGLLLGWLGLTGGVAGPLPLILLPMAAVTLWAGERLRRATRFGIELSDEGLSDTGGRSIARWADIARVERGTFSMKPSNGFGLVLHTPGPRAWAPGLWWRSGRRVGIGGVLPGPATRAMAERIALRLVSA